MVDFDAAAASMTGEWSATRLSGLIGAIYDCVLDPNRWYAVLEDINRQFRFASSVLGVMPLRAGSQVVNFGVGLDDLLLATAALYADERVSLWGGAERVRQHPLDEPLVASQSPGYSGRYTNAYFVKVLEPLGLTDAIALAIAREPSLIGYAAFNRHVSDGAIGESEVQAIRLLGPHLRRAVTISNLFNLRAIEANALFSVLESLAYGLALVDETLAVIHANAAARAMFAAGTPVRSNKGTFTLKWRAGQDALERAVRQASTDVGALGPRGLGIPAVKDGSDNAVVHVLPLKNSDLVRGLARRATAALFVAPGTAPPSVPTAAIALLYDLTPAEARIFELIQAGLTQAQIGNALGVARSTVKTHVLHLFQKTNCKRQADLVRLAAGVSLPI